MLCHVQSPPSKPFKRQSRRQNTRASPTGRLLTSVSNCHSRRRRGTGRLMLARCANTGVPVALLGPSEPPVSRENDSPRTATNETNQKKCYFLIVVKGAIVMAMILRLGTDLEGCPSSDLKCLSVRILVPSSLTFLGWTNIYALQERQK
jgi:hypothetical protein